MSDEGVDNSTVVNSTAREILRELTAEHNFDYQDSTSASTSSQHLPECEFTSEAHWLEPAGICICAPLRACEQRVAGPLLKAGHNWLHTTGYSYGYAHALNAAEAAVAAECHHDDPNEWCVYVEAIRALKEKP